MEGTIFGSQIVPDQVQVINPALVLLLIPFFDRIFYPFLARFNMLENPLYRMAIGGLIAGLAFISAGMLELILEKNYPQVPGNKEATINFINTLPCDTTVQNPFNRMQIIHSTEIYSFRNIFASNYSKYKISVTFPKRCGKYVFNDVVMNLEIYAAEHEVNMKSF